MANISRNSFNEAKQYDKVILQQGVPVTDYDFNEAQDIQRVKLRRIVKELLGDGAIGDGFKVVAQATPNQTVLVKKGTLYVDGYRVVLDQDVTVPLPAAPNSGTRIDYVYAEVTEQEVDSVQDPYIKHPRLTLEPTRRIKIAVNFKVGTSVPPSTDTVKRYTLAEINRTANDNTINDTDIVDRREVKAEFLGEGFTVRGSVTLGDAESDVIDLLGAIKNTSGNFGGFVYIDDNAKVTGELQVLNKGTFTGDLRTDGNVYVKGAIINDQSTNGGYVFVNDNFRVDGTMDFNGSASFSGNVAIEGTSKITFYSDTDNASIGMVDYGSDLDWLTIDFGDNPESDRVRFRFKGFNGTINVMDIISNLVQIYQNADIDGTLTVNGATTLTNTLSVSGATTTLTYNGASAALTINQQGAGLLADFKQNGITKISFTNAGGITASSDITTSTKVTATGDIRTSANLYVQGAIMNDQSTNGGAVLVNDALTVAGNLTVNEGYFIDNPTNVSSADQTVIKMGGTGGKEFQIIRTTEANGNGLKIKNIANNQDLLTFNDTETLFSSKNVRIATNLDVDGTLNVDSTSTFNNNVTLAGTSGLTVNNGAVTFTRNNTAPTMIVRQGGAGHIARFGTTDDDSKVVIDNAGNITTKGRITATGDIVATGKVVQTGKYYEVARIPLFGIAGDIQYQSDSTTWEDVTPTLYWLFDFANNRTMLPPVPSGATRKYKLRMAYSQSDGSKQMSVRLITQDLATTALTWNVYPFTGALNGERIYQESPEFTQGDTTNHWKIQAMITGGEMTIHWVELVAYDVYC